MKNNFSTFHIAIPIINKNQANHTNLTMNLKH